MNKLILLSIAFLVLGCNLKDKTSNKSINELPYYEEATFTPRWFSGKESVPKDFHQIPKFSLLNQHGKVITEKEVDGKIYVVDFFFTSCPGICPKMISNMHLVEEAFNDDEVLLLSHTVTPEYDSVPVLKEYADREGIKDGKWHLLTGERDQIYDLGRNQYFVEENQGLEKQPEDFLHTENFVLVDANRYIRGIYNGLNKTDVNQLISDIYTLKISGAN